MDGLIVEVLGRGNRAEQRVRVASFPATIGRSYAADVSLDDPYVDAVHARLVRDETGALFVEDAGSTNGLSLSEHGERVERLPLRPGATFRVGHTMLRVATPDMAVPPALRDDRRGSRLLRSLHSRRLAGALTIAGSLLYGVAFYLASMERNAATDFASGALGALAVVLAWAGAWALGTRLRSGHARFLAHYNIAWLAFLVLMVMGVSEEWYRFFAGDVWSADTISFLTYCVAVIGPVYASLTVASRLRRVSRLLIGAGVALVVLGLGELGEAGDEYGSSITIQMPLKPVPAALVPAMAPDEFLEAIAPLQQEVDEAASEDDTGSGGEPAAPAAPDSATPGPSAARTSRGL